CRESGRIRQAETTCRRSCGLRQAPCEQLAHFAATHRRRRQGRPPRQEQLVGVRDITFLRLLLIGTMSEPALAARLGTTSTIVRNAAISLGFRRLERDTVTARYY